jgi:subtilisin-like proprotein convertase family protein
MRSRATYWILLCLVIVAGAWFFWPRHTPMAAAKKVVATPTAVTTRPASTAPNFLIVSTNSIKATAAAAKTNKFAYRLCNTSKSIGELMSDRKAILLENAFIDTGAPLNLAIPKKLQAQGDPGAYIIQARGPIDNTFRAILTSAGAQIISYIPNNAYLVNVSAAVANQIASLGFAVIPYEPYYKLSPQLASLAMGQGTLPADPTFNVELFPGQEQPGIAQITNAGWNIVPQSPLIFKVQSANPNWIALAQLPQVHIIEMSHQRAAANDLSRVTMGISVDTVTNANYLNLSGSNVVVEVNDSGIDMKHPDFSVTGSAENPGTVPPSRVTGDSALSLVDTNGHGTHVAGIIAGNGSESYTVIDTPQGSVTNADFRGKAPAASLFSVAALDNGGGVDIPDSYLQSAPATNHALISNNSWGYAGDTEYDLAAASYDAAVRDALPEVTGSSPVLFVFAAGNDGNGDDTTDPGGGVPDTISSPGTAKNVITVGALQQDRNITNMVTNADGTISAPWQNETTTSYRVASFSSRGNVGIGTEGTFGRFKPDVVAPGTFVVSTRSSQWDVADYFYQNPTNYDIQDLSVVVQGDSLGAGQFPLVPTNAVGVSIQVAANSQSPTPFPNLPIYVGTIGSPIYNYGPVNNQYFIPPQMPDIATIIAGESTYGFNYAISNVTSDPINFDITLDTITTNNVGNYQLVYSNLDNTLGQYYRYETGTSMSAAAVSGMLALLQDYFTNTLRTIPSPALLKAMVINGAAPTGFYDLQVQNNINYVGWGLVNLPNSLPAAITNSSATNSSFFFADQSVTNALATGDSHTYMVSINNSDVQTLPLRVTLVWTDPPGDPAAAVKLVNNLDLIVTNLNSPTNPIIYYGNDIPSGSAFNNSEISNTPPVLDSINNVENVFVAPGLGTNFSVTVVGRDVNVNAVTAQTNSVVQDYALVISCGAAEVTNAITVTDSGIISNPTSGQQITFVTSTNTVLFNQFAGASSPLLGTNTISTGTNQDFGTNALITLGMTNQWHFYVVTNTLGYANAAFLTFFSETLAIPRMGVFADSTADATRPEADIDLYVASLQTDPNAAALTNLDPNVISNCVNGVNGDGASLGPGGTEFVAYSNSAAGDVYYIGVKSEDREAAEYDFLPVFSQMPFSLLNPDGSQTVNGLLVPQNIPDGSPAHPGTAYIIGLALYPMELSQVVVGDTITHQNFGDLTGTLNHNDITAVLNNHDSLGNPPGPYSFIYDDSGSGLFPGSQPSDGPGSLNSYIGTEGIGPWILTEVDNALTQTGTVTAFTMTIEPQKNLQNGFTNIVPAMSWFYDFIDVPAGFTNLTIGATNVGTTISPQALQMYTRFGAEPTLTNYDQTAGLTNGVSGTFPTTVILPGNAITNGPPLPAGRYFVGIYNPSSTEQTVFIVATLGGAASAVMPTDYSAGGSPILDDAVTTNNNIQVTNLPASATISSVNVGIVVNHPRISDLTFTLVSPTGQRVLLMENRGGTTTNGAGGEFIATNSIPTVTSSGSAAANTNFINVGETSGSLTINYNMYTIPDEMTVYYSTNIIPANLLRDTGLTNGTGTFTVNFGPGASTYVTIIMNQNGNTNGGGGDAWTYSAGGVQTNFNYLMFTEDTNLTTTPIKFAVPPFTVTAQGTNYTLSDFELATNGGVATNADYFAPASIYDPNGGWTLPTNVIAGGTTNLLTNNEVSVVTDPANAGNGSNFLALAYGTITRTIPMTVGKQFNLSFQYRGPGISGWYRGEGNATDSSDPETNGNNGELIGRFNFPAGEVGQSFEMEDAGNEFQFAGTNTYVQIHQPPFFQQVVSTSGSNDAITVETSSLNVGAGSGLTVEGWINPTNVSYQQPLVEWLARAQTNGADTNLIIQAGPFLDPATGHYYYLLGSTNWSTSELWAEQLGGHLVTLDTANEQNWVFDTFANYGGTNRNLWIGLNDVAAPPNLVWSSGASVVYTNWLTGEPTNCSGADFYTTMLGSTNGQPGLWLLANNNGLTCDLPATNKNYGVVEVNNIQTNGVQFWISITNSPVTTNPLVSSNGCLYADLVDITNGSHEIFSAPGLIQSNVFQHVALTYNTNSGVAKLYYNGTNVASTNLGIFTPKTTGDVLLGKDMSRATNNFYGGEMDEMSIYARALSDSEIAAIYHVSASATNRNLGKFDPTVPPPENLAEAQVSLGGMTNVIYGQNNQWQSQSFTFTATTNLLPMQISGLEPGLLLDTFVVSEIPLGNLYYLPEQSLASLDGTPAAGTWTLQVWDNRTGAYITNAEQLVSWQLQFVLNTNTATATALNPQQPGTIIVPPGQIGYLSVTVPTWANFATNILVSSTLPVDLLFNQTTPPTGTVPPDTQLLTGSTGPNAIGNPILSATSTPPLLPGQTYYLGVRNNGTAEATAVVEVDYDITGLTNGLPYTGLLNTNDQVRYFAYNVSSNAVEATFQLLQLSNNADLVLSKGAPLPTLFSDSYGSFNAGNVDENIYVLTNSSPVPLSPGIWYLGVFKGNSTTVNYSVLAKELDTNQPTIIPLTNNVPFNFTAGPGAALTNFFRFNVTSFPASIRFELFNLSGNGDLTVQTNGPPLAPPFFQSSQQPGRTPELIFMATNSALSSLTNSTLTNLNAQWYLGVPNHEITNITYTILAVLGTNSVFPTFPTAEGAGAGALGGGSLPARGGFTNSTVYHVTSLGDSGLGTLRDAVSSTNRTIVFDISGTINLLSQLVITNSYLTIAGQTAPGGITVAGDMTTVQSAHDVVIRYIRFRPSNAVTNNPGDSLQFTNAQNVMVDHVSTSWSSNDLVSVLGSTNVTVQWSIMADSLYITNNPHGFGSLLRYGQGALSFHHNLYADNYNANPRLGDNLSLDFVNNVIYDWGTNSGYSANDTNNLFGFTNQLNYVCNYLIATTNSVLPAVAFRGGSTNTWIFQTNNFIDSNTNHILDGANTGWNMFTNLYTQTNRAFPLPSVDTDEAFLAYEKVLDFAGAALFTRDFVDDNIVLGVRNQTGTLISAPPSSGIVAWWKGENNAFDSIGTNNGIMSSGLTFTNGEVRQAFFMNNTNAYFHALASPSLNVGLGSGFTIEGWIKPSDVNGLHPIVEWNDQVGGTIGVQFWIGQNPSSLGVLCAFVLDTNGLNYVQVPSPSGTLIPNTFQHVAMTYDKNSGYITLYVNGAMVANYLWGNFTPLTSYDFWVGHRPEDCGGGCWTDGTYLGGVLDELSLYNRALSASEIKAIYDDGSAGKFAASPSPAPPLDSDQDGIPDYWEITLGTDPYVASNNNPSSNTNDIGYSDLEEYLNWLGAPHALTLTNTPVGVDLYKLAGNTGNLSFSVTNGINGSVYLTNVLGSATNTGIYSNSFAIFTPTNAPGTNFSGYASFDFNVTNNDTIAYFGPVTVSVMVSKVPVLKGGIVPLTNMIPYGPVTSLTSTPVAPASLTGADGLDYYVYDVSTNAIAVEFQILNASSNVVLYVTDGLPLPPAPGHSNYSTNAGFGTNATILVLPTSTPLPLTNGNWYLAVSNATGAPVTYTIEVTEIFTNGTPPMFSTNAPDLTNDELVPITVTNTAADTNAGVTLTYTVTMTIDTNAMIANGWPLTYATTNPSPVISTNGIITWTPSEAQGPGVYTITTVVTDNSAPPESTTNSFNVTVNEVNMSPFFLATPPNQTIPALSPLTVSDTATDLDIPPNPLTYQLIGPSGATIDANGIITWTPTSAQAGNTYTFTNIVTDTNQFAVNAKSLSATNTFTVNVFIVAPPFAFTQPATAVTGASAQLNGMATANGLSATAWFQWGTNTTYGNQTPPVSVGTSFNVFYTTNQISGLVPNVPYHFQLVVSNSLGVAYGFDQILDEAKVVGWGADYLGQINVPSGLSNVVAIAGAYDHSLALKNDGTVAAWGDNTFGQTNVPAGLNNNLVAVAGGESFSLALKNSGTVVAWGGNIFPGETNVPSGLNNVVTIAGGQYSSLALKNNGTIVAWGANISGLTNVPAGLSNAVAIAGGSFHSLAIKNDGTVVAWGDDSAGQTNVPVGLTNVVAISGGSFHSLALKTNGTVVAWGDNSAGQTNVPSGLSNVVAIAAGGFHSLALKSDGSIVTWGDSSAGQTSVPFGLSNVVAIAAGNLHSLALTPYFNVNPTNPAVLSTTNGMPQTNTVGAGGIIYYRINVPTNADLATNILFTLDTNELVNVWFTTNSPPSITTNATLLLVGSTNSSSSSVLSTTSAPTNIVRGGTYYLGVQNTNSSSAFYAIEVDFHLLTSTSAPPVSISSIVYTNGGFLLTWFAPSNDLFLVQWNNNLGSTNWQTFTNPASISYNTNIFPVSATNAQFNFFDNGSQTPPGLPPLRFYRLILLQSTNPPPSPQTNTVPISSVTYTNSGFLLKWLAPTNDIFQVQFTDSLAPANWQSFSSIITYTGPGVTTNGQFTFFDNGSQYPFTGLRFYRLILLGSSPAFTGPPISNIFINGSGLNLEWFAPPNDQFEVRWTTNLTPVINWNLFSNIITSTNGTFLFTDTNAPLLMKFYQLLLLP